MEENMRHKVLVVAALVLATLLLGAPSAQAASGTTNVSISYPPMTILYYYTLVPVTLAAGDLATLFGSDSVATANAGSGTNVVANPDVKVTPGTALTTTLNPAATAVGLVLMSNWTVRSVGNAAGNTQVAVALTANTALTAGAGNTITVTAVGTRIGVAAFAANTSFPPTGLGGSQTGDVRLTLDLSSALRAGSYTNVTGGQYMITVTNL
jgi:hypothetical protein